MLQRASGQRVVPAQNGTPVKAPMQHLLAPCRYLSGQAKTAAWLAPGGWHRQHFVGRLVHMAAAKRVPSTEAHELLQSGLPYLDVRTPEEYAAGHAPRAVNIPFWLKTAEGMLPNPEFTTQVQKAFPNTQEAVVVGCRSGNRSAKACAQLEQELSYSNLIDDAGGWLGWVEAQLPVEIPAKAL